MTPAKNAARNRLPQEEKTVVDAIPTKEPQYIAAAYEGNTTAETNPTMAEEITPPRDNSILMR